MVKIFGLGILVLSLFGCIKQLEPNAVELTGPKVIPRTAPNCAGCHKYPLNDINHQFHLNAANDNLLVPYPIQRASRIPVCIDCHFGSIAHQAYNYSDTVWQDADGNPLDRFSKLPDSPILSIDSTIPGIIPLPWGWDGEIIKNDNLQFKIDSLAKIGEVLEWMTGKKHMNKRVDVEFAPSIVPDSVLRDSAYNPIDFSCSNIDCHGTPELKYRWANKSKKLSLLPER